MNGEDLFEGIEIMTPQQLESSLTPQEEVETSTEDKGLENKGMQEEEENENGFSISQVSQFGKTEETTKEPTGAPTQTEALYDALIKELHKDGIISIEEAEKLDDLPKNKETLKKLVEQTTEHRAKEKQDGWKKKFTGAKKRFLEIEESFDDTDKAILAAQRLDFFDNLDEDTVKGDTRLLKNLYYEQLVNKNFSHEDAIEAIEDAEKMGKLSQKGLAAIPELKKQATDIVAHAANQKKLAEEEEEKEYTDTFNSLLKVIDDKESFIEGLPLNKVQREKLKANITNTVHTDEDGRAYTSLMHKQKQNPIEFELLINYYDSLGMFNIDKDSKFKPDISKIKATVKTQAISELDSVVSRMDSKSVGRNTSVEQSDIQKGIFDMLERAEKENK